MKRILKSIVLLLGVLMLPAPALAQNIYGDVNSDLEVNIADVNVVIDVILNDVPNAAADVNKDSEINIADVNAIIDIILNGGIDPHLLEVCERVSEIDHDIKYYYEECETLEELKEHAAEIEALEGVEYVFFDNNTSMYVKIKDFGTISYSYFPELEISDSTIIQYSKFEHSLQKAIVQTTHSHQDFGGVLIVNQQSKDENRMFYSKRYEKFLTFLLDCGFEQSRIEPSPDVEFFRNGIFENDYVFLITHGGYEFDKNEYDNNPLYRGLHWLLTSEEVSLDSDGNILPTELANLRERYNESDVSIGTIKEQRNGEWVRVRYKKVSDQFIASSEKSFNNFGKAIVFNTACHSMQGPGMGIYEGDTINYRLATAFSKNGAGIYLGYDESNSHGKLAGLQFYYNLLSGMSIQSACDNLQFDNLHEYLYNNDSESWYWADLIQHCPQQDFYNTCIIRPSIQFDDNSTESELSISLHANSYFRSYNLAYTARFVSDVFYLWSDVLSYGFELSESEQFTNALKLGEKRIGDENCHLEENNSLVDYSQSLNYSAGQADSKIKPNTTYWARAYVYDGQGYNYSEPITFTTGSISGGTQEHEYVDLGLPSGTLWATCNIGATTPEEYGDYFAWGETEPKESYNFDNYKWCNGSRTTMTKYCTSSSYGTVDNKSELDPEDDAAYVNWGPLWRMPSSEQIDELRTICTWQGTTRNGVDGQLVTGPNGNSLFLPAAGFFNGLSLIKAGWEGSCWSRTLDSDISNCAYDLSYDLVGAYWSINYREMGISVRAVHAAPEDGQGLYVEQQSLDLGEVPIGETRTGELTIINNSASLKTVIAVADTPFGFKEGESCVSSMTVMVPSNSSGSVTIQFTATTLGDYSGNITFQNFALDGGQCVVPVQAHAVSVEPQGDYIDLGLPSGTLWATRNIGASNPEDYGDYFAWGETSPKEVYKWSTYKWCSGASNQMTKYCTQSVFGTVDSKTELDLEDDAAYVNWGPNWRMPSFDQQYELWQCCSRQWTTRNGVNGELVTGPNGNTLFFPASGDYNGGSNGFEGFSGDYWSRTLDSRTPNQAYGLYIHSGGMFCDANFRCYGHTVRAVRVSDN